MLRVTSIFSLICLSFSVFAQEKVSISAPLTFKEAIEIGLKNNIDIKAQENQLYSSQAQKLNSVSQYLPSVSARGQGFRTEGQQINAVTGDGENVASDQFFASLDASVTLFNGLNNRYTLKSAASGMSSQLNRVERTKQDVISQITRQFLQVLLDKELLKIAEENVEAQTLILEQIKGFVEAGTRAKPDEMAQRSIVKSNELALIRAKGAYENDKATLSQLLQIDALTDYEIESPAWDVNELMMNKQDLDALSNLAMANRVDLKQTEMSAESAEYSMKSSATGYFPTIGLFASYGSRYFAIQGNDNTPTFRDQFVDLNPALSYGFSFNIPIFDRFRTNANKARAKVTYLNAQNDYENLQKTVKIDVQRSYQNFENATAGYQAAQAQLESSQLSFDLEKERFELGLSGLVDFDQANQRFIQAKGDMAQATFTLLFQDILLQYATGTLTAADIP